MKILEDAGLVNKERQGTWMIYSRAEGSESVYARALLTTLKDWLNDDAELRRMMKALSEPTCQRLYTLKK